MTIREARLKKCLTLREAAASIGVHLTALQQWETDKRPVPARHVLAVERVLGIPREKLLPDLFKRAPRKRITSTAEA